MDPIEFADGSIQRGKIYQGRFFVSEKELGDQTQELLQLLGDDHDLAILRETLAADPLAYGGHGVLKNVFAVIDRGREQLERQAFALGQEIYKDPPKVFTSRIEALMNYQEVK